MPLLHRMARSTTTQRRTGTAWLLTGAAPLLSAPQASAQTGPVLRHPTRLTRLWQPPSTLPPAP
jgi:hypothetical protein